MADEVSPLELVMCAKINFENAQKMMPVLGSHPVFQMARQQLDEALRAVEASERQAVDADTSVAGQLERDVGETVGPFLAKCLGVERYDGYESDGTIIEALQYEITSVLVAAGILDEDHRLVPDLSKEAVALREEVAQLRRDVDEEKGRVRGLKADIAGARAATQGARLTEQQVVHVRELVKEALDERFDSTGVPRG